MSTSFIQNFDCSVRELLRKSWYLREKLEFSPRAPVRYLFEKTRITENVRHDNLHVFGIFCFQKPNRLVLTKKTIRF